MEEGKWERVGEPANQKICTNYVLRGVLSVVLEMFSFVDAEIYLMNFFTVEAVCAVCL